MIEDLFAQPIVVVAKLARVYAVSYPTASADIRKLESLGIIRELPAAYPKAYFAPEIMKIAYRELGNT